MLGLINIYRLIIVGSLALSSTFATDTIITTSPSLTEVVFQLGFGHSILAASHFSDFPDEAKQLPRIGSLFSANIETILRFAPNWVLIDSESTSQDMGEQLSGIGQKSINIKIKSVGDLFSESEKVLKNIFRQENVSVIEQYRELFLRNKANLFRNFNFIAIAWIAPTVLIGNNTFLSDLLNQVGGKNLVAEITKVPYPTIADEWLMKRHPDYVFILADSKEQFQTIKTTSAHWWPKQDVKFIFLPSSWYARTSFSPLTHLEMLWSNIE